MGDAAVAPAPTIDSGGTPSATLGTTEKVSTVDPRELKGLECQTVFREKLVAYDKDAVFGPEVVDRLAREFLSERTDCGEVGWSPVFDFDRVCTEAKWRYVGYIDGGLRRPKGSGGVSEAVGTARSKNGSMLIHFAKVPMVDWKGCWYYKANGRSWSWFVGGDPFGSQGLDEPVFPWCETRLKSLLESEASAGSLSAARIGQLVQYVYFEFGDKCPRHVWSPLPLDGSTPVCGDGWSTGILDDGTVVVNWYDEFTPVSGARCWVLPSGGDEWEEYFDDVGVQTAWERRGKLIESYTSPVAPPAGVDAHELPEGVSFPRVVDSSVPSSVPEWQVDEDWYNAAGRMSFYQDSSGDETGEALRDGHSHRELVYFEGYPPSVPNFHSGSLQYLLAVELAFGAVKALPILGNPSGRDVGSLGSGLGWELVNTPGLVVNIWDDIERGGGDDRHTFRVGGVMRLEVESQGEGEGRIDYLVPGEWIGPVAVERE